MDWPQIVIISLYAINVYSSMENHGKPKTGKDDFFASLFAAIIFSTILYLGGFWT